MKAELENIPLVDNTTGSRFELTVDHYTGFITYRLQGDKIYLLHTEVPEQLSGKGAGAALVEKTLRYIEAHHLKLIPYCPFVIAYLKRHPEWQRLLDAGTKIP
ncbi:GNAT family N-acetyltransferase [Compostibacter hankyongensis]|uniref:GNAT family N-acetyltransferase n=1 Tax=Compostibacter hankyongensis TaxID=1007089 RepID=A0ABP8FM14_9BACT